MEQYLKQMFGDLLFQIAKLQAEVDALKAALAALTPKQES